MNIKSKAEAEKLWQEVAEYEKAKSELEEDILNYLRSKNINYGLASDALRDVLDYLQKEVWLNPLR